MIVPPPPPPGFMQPAEYPLGDSGASSEQRALGRVMDALEPRYGRPAVAWLSSETAVDASAVRSYYDEEFGGEWHKLAQLDAGPGAQAFGYADDHRAFVVILPAADHVVTTLTFGASDRPR